MKPAEMDFRYLIFTGQKLADLVIPCRDEVADTIFFSFPQHPLNNPEAALTEALKGYWAMLNGVVEKFEISELNTLLNLTCTYWFEYKTLSRERILEDLNSRFHGDGFNEQVIHFKSVVLPKLARLSTSELRGIADVICLLHNIDADDPLLTLAIKIPSLANRLS